MPKIRVVPEKLLNPDHPGYFREFGDYVAGGKYLCEGLDVTGWTLTGCHITSNLDGRRPQFRFCEVAAPQVARRGATIMRVNLIRQQAGWRWNSFVTINGDYQERLRAIDTLVSVEFKGKHTYAISANFDYLKLERYPDAPSEPRLRPTGRATDLVVGSVAGTILMRGRLHTVHHVVAGCCTFED